MSNEISLFISRTVRNGYFNDPVSESVQITQSAVGSSAGTRLIAAKIAGTVLHGLNQKPSAKCATTTTLPANTYANGSSGAGATLTATGNGAFAAVDGVTLAINEYILVKDEASGLKCGLYKLTAVGDGSNPYVLTRVTSMDTTGEFVGASVYIESGAVNGGNQWTCTNASAPTVGTTAITFSKSAAGTVIASGDLLTPGECFLKNLDVANYITYGPEIGGVMMPLGRITAGCIASFRLEPTVTWRALADTGAAKLLVDILEN